MHILKQITCEFNTDLQSVFAYTHALQYMMTYIDMHLHVFEIIFLQIYH